MKHSKVDVSIVMPVYNATLTIDAAVQSVLGQKGVIFEFLIGDDASKDETWKRLQRYAAHSQVRIMRFNKNRGAAYVRNQLMAKARGRYLAFCDADDQLLPGHLKRLTGALDQREAFGAVYGDCYQVDNGGRQQLVKRRFVFNRDWDLLGGGFMHGGVVIRRSVMRQVKGYREKLKFLEDCDLFLRLSEVTRFYYYRGKPLYVRLKQAGSLSDQPRQANKKISQQLLRDTIQRRYGYKVRW